MFQKKIIKKASAQVQIAIGVIFIFNAMSQCEMVQQIKILMYSVNSFHVIDLVWAELR